MPQIKREAKSYVCMSKWYIHTSSFSPVSLSEAKETQCRSFKPKQEWQKRTVVTHNIWAHESMRIRLECWGAFSHIKLFPCNKAEIVLERDKTTCQLSQPYFSPTECIYKAGYGHTKKDVSFYHTNMFHAYMRNGPTICTERFSNQYIIGISSCTSLMSELNNVPRLEKNK